MSDSVELLSPAGNFETALAAFAAGADAVYCGLTEFSARAFADNFGIEELKNLLRYARGRAQTPAAPQSSGNAESFGPDCGAPGVRPLPRRVYVTFNTVIDEDNLESAIEQLARLDEVRPDALIVQDLGVARLCRKHFPELELHASTISEVAIYGKNEGARTDSHPENPEDGSKSPFIDNKIAFYLSYVNGGWK